MPDELKAGLERSSGLDLSNVRVHRNSPLPARMNALAFTQGQTIHLAPDQETHLPHEGWHVVQQLQGRVRADGRRLHGLPVNADPALEAEADRLGRRAADPAAEGGSPQPGPPRARPSVASDQPVQQKVRTDGGRRRVDEAQYLPGGSKSGVGSRHSVASLIQDGVQRVFTGVAELEAFANGQTDFIGDVRTASAGTFWYRLPENDLTVLGEQHHNPQGNVEDVVVGLGTSRFMYEPIHEFTSVAPFGASQIGGGTQARMRQVEGGLAVGPLMDRRLFDPHLENIVIKALTGATMVRNEFIAASPATMGPIDRQTWSGRPSTSNYSFGERAALYLSMAIHIANDLSTYNLGQEILIESLYYTSVRRLTEFYQANRNVLDTFMTTKDNDDLIGIYELTSPNNFANLPVINQFTLHFHEYGSRYIEQLGRQNNNMTLQAEGNSLSSNLSATLTSFSPAREEIMWQRIQTAHSNSYLIVGMGDAHRQNLQTRLDAAGIRHEEVAQGLQTQRAGINRHWTP